MLMQLPLLLGVLAVGDGASADVLAARSAPVDVAGYFRPGLTLHALERGMSPEVALLYSSAIAATRSGEYREALVQARQARALSFLQLQRGPVSSFLARRHFLRASYLESQLAEMTLIEEQLAHSSEQTDERALLLQLRPLVMHNLCLVVRSYTGRVDSRLLGQMIAAYTTAKPVSGQLKLQVQLGYAAALAERGDLASARAEFAQQPTAELQAGQLDLNVAYYFTAVGDVSRAIERLSEASRRDTWLRSGRDATGVRAQAYRLCDFDRLREHPRFIDLVIEPEER